MSLFDDIASGADRLRRGEDALIWSMRADGKPWREIEAAMREQRERWRAHGEAMMLRRYAGRWRDEIRQERARG